jgi:hypothetical protein
MPKPKRPRSKPDLADRLCDAIKHLTSERASRSLGPQSIALSDAARRLGITDEQAQQAVALGLARRLILTAGAKAKREKQGNETGACKESQGFKAFSRLLYRQQMLNAGGRPARA